MKKLILTLAIMLCSTQVWASSEPNLPADIALGKLKNGNERYAAYQMKHPNTQKSRREHLIKGQHPFAVVIACSDSRVAPEIIFDQGLGDIFVIRNAGNVLDEHVMGSVEYAVHHLGVNLVVVLGHESCGAVGAAMKEGKELPSIECIKASIAPAVSKSKAENNFTYDRVIQNNAKLVVDGIMGDKDFAKYANEHNVKVLPAYYSISTGKVDYFTIAK